MKVKATTNFAGEICMARGDVRDVPESVAAPLLECGYLEALEPVQTSEQKDEQDSETEATQESETEATQESETEATHESETETTQKPETETKKTKRAKAKTEG